MYLALQHGVFVANYPLVPEDLDATDLPRPVRRLRDCCFGMTTTPTRLTQVRNERRPNSRYASLEQCSYELRRAEALYRSHRIPMINSSAKSVEEMSTVILQFLKRKEPVMSSNVLWFSELGLADPEQVGGKNSSLGEMVSNLAKLGVGVPDGFATTAEAYRGFIGDTGLAETISRLAGLDTEDVGARPGRPGDPRRRRHPAFPC